jgi:hypothetical protein
LHVDRRYLNNTKSGGAYDSGEVSVYVRCTKRATFCNIAYQPVVEQFDRRIDFSAGYPHSNAVIIVISSYREHRRRRVREHDRCHNGKHET